MGTIVGGLIGALLGGEHEAQSSHAIKAASGAVAGFLGRVHVERYPTLETRRQVEVGQEFSVSFSLTEKLHTPEVTVPHGTVTPEGKLHMQLPERADGWTIDVVLFAEGFTLRGPDAAKILLPRQGDSEPALFLLVAEPIVAQKQKRTLYVTLWHEGMYLARIAREITVVNPAKTSVSSPSEPSTRGLASAQPLSPPKPVSLDLTLQPPDLTVFMLRSTGPEAPGSVDVLIESPYLQPIHYRYRLPADVAAWLRGYFGQLSRMGRGVVLMPHGAASDASPQQRLEQAVAFAKGFGRTVYERLAPEPFKIAFWDLKQQLGPGFQSIQILSNDPLIPWELMLPTREGQETGFLGTDFRIARWHVAEDTGMLAWPPQDLMMKELAVIAPTYRDHPLPEVAVEMDTLKKIPGFRAVPGRYDAVSQLFGAGGVDRGIIHFAGHGTVHEVAAGVDEYAIQLEDQAIDLMTWRGLVLHAQKGHPLLFFNACDVGQAQHVLNFVDGWAPAVLGAGASGYISGLWPLSDHGATEFAVHFYGLVDTKLQAKSVSVADALRETRKLFFATGDPTFLGYVYYGDPNLYLTR